MTLLKTSSTDAMWASGWSQVGVARAGCNLSLFQNVWWLSVPNACLVCLQPPLGPHCSHHGLWPGVLLVCGSASGCVKNSLVLLFSAGFCRSAGLSSCMAEMVSDSVFCHSWFCRPMSSSSSWLLTCLKSCLLRYSLYGSHSWPWASLSRSLSWFYMSF